MRRSMPVAVFLLAIVLTACGSDPTPTARPDTSGPQGGSALESGFGSIAEQPTSERLIVRDAELQLAFDDVAGAAERIEDVAESHGGRVQASRVTGDGDEARGTMTLRVPSASFSQVIDDIKAFAARVVSEETTSDDVTDEYVDLDAQVRNLQATESQLQTLMERAETIPDVLRVQGELNSVRGQIERLQGRMQLLSQTAAESLIVVSLVPTAVSRPIADSSWAFGETLHAATRSLVFALRVVADVATWVLVLLPVWGPVAALGWVGWRRGWFGGPRAGEYGRKAPSASPKGQT